MEQMEVFMYQNRGFWRKPGLWFVGPVGAHHAPHPQTRSDRPSNAHRPAMPWARELTRECSCAICDVRNNSFRTHCLLAMAVAVAVVVVGVAAGVVVVVVVVVAVVVVVVVVYSSSSSSSSSSI